MDEDLYIYYKKKSYRIIVYTVSYARYFFRDKFFPDRSNADNNKMASFITKSIGMIFSVENHDADSPGDSMDNAFIILQAVCAAHRHYTTMMPVF